MASKNPEKREPLPPWVFPALIVAGILLSRVLVAGLEGIPGAKGPGLVLHVLANAIIPVLLLCLLYRTGKIYRLGGTGRAAAYFLLGGLALFFIVAEADLTEKLQIPLYFLLGATLYRVRSAGGKNADLRCYLDIFLAISITVFIEEIVKGISPVARYEPGIGHDNAVGMVGAFFARNLDFQRPYRFKRTDRTQAYAGPAPLLDLHLNGRDLFFVAVLGALLLVQFLIGAFYRVEDIAGEWRLQGTGDPAFQLSPSGGVRCQAGDAGWRHIRRWGIEGNLLDGYYLFMVPQRRTENACCSFLNPWFEERNRFRLLGDSVVFDSVTSDWVWPLKTLLRWKPGGKGTAQWQRVE